MTASSTIGHGIARSSTKAVFIAVVAVFAFVALSCFAQAAHASGPNAHIKDDIKKYDHALSAAAHDGHEVAKYERKAAEANKQLRAARHKKHVNHERVRHLEYVVTLNNTKADHQRALRNNAQHQVTHEQHVLTPVLNRRYKDAENRTETFQNLCEIHPASTFCQEAIDSRNQQAVLYHERRELKHHNKIKL